VFQDYNYARLHKNEKKLIGASITIRSALDESDYEYNIIRYTGELSGVDYSHPSSIHCDVFIEPRAFRELAENTRNGLLPQTITIEFSRPSFFTATTNKKETPKKPPLEFGWEPDGSGMVWHNKEEDDRIIPVASVRLDYAVVKAQYDDKQAGRLLPIQSYTDRISDQISPLQTALANMLKELRWTRMGVIALVIVVIWFSIARRLPF
jgi:hypothetical protein